VEDVSCAVVFHCCFPVSVGVSVGFGATADLMRKETLPLGRRLQRLRQLKPNDYAGSEALPG